MTQVPELRTHFLDLIRTQSVLLLLPLLALSIGAIGCVKRERAFAGTSIEHSTKANEQQSTDSRSTPGESISRININTAPAKELEQLPGIGPAMAARIIEHREKHGPFRRPEHLITVRGLSDKRFRALKDLIRVE